MEVRLTDDQKAFIRHAIESGRYASEEDALRADAPDFPKATGLRAEILVAVDQAEASFVRGEGRRITTREEASQLANEIKQRGQRRFTSQENNR